MATTAPDEIDFTQDIDINKPSTNAHKSPTKHFPENKSNSNQTSPNRSDTNRPRRAKKRKNRAKKPTQTTPAQPTDHPKSDDLQKAVTNALKNCRRGQELQALCYTLQPDNDWLLTAFNRIKADLHRTIANRFPNDNIEIYCFGSTLNGLAFKDSDFDLYVQMNAENLPSKKLVYVVSAQMKTNQLFTKTVCVARAKVPILKCYHPATRFYCDISFSNGTNSLGVYNTNALRHLLGLDYRMHPLAIILKYYLRTHELSGTGRITNYCLFLMILYYLQNVKPPIYPPLSEFQKNCPQQNIDFWNVAFDFSYQLKSKNNSKVADLVVGFLEFYRDFEFGRYVICPLYGKMYNREVFASKKIPSEFNRYNAYLRTPNANHLNVSSSICVQDPFNLSHNVAASCYKFLFDRFKVEIAFAAKMCRAALTRNGESAEVLLNLFNQSAPVDPKQPKSGEFFCRIKPVEVELSILRTILAQSQTSTVVELADVHRKWTEKIIEFIVLIFEKLFLFEVTPIEKQNGTGKKSTRSEGQDDIHCNKFHKKFKLHGAFNVYQGKSNFKGSAANYLQECEKHARNIFEKKGSPIDLHCCVDISTVQEHKAVDIKFMNDTEKVTDLKQVFNQFSNRCRNDLKAYFQKYRDECLQINT